MIFLPSAEPGDDYLQVFVTCATSGCNTTGDYQDAHMLLFTINPLVCTSSRNCSYDQYCDTSSKRCLELSCGLCDNIENHTCVFTCNDSDICTVDFCSEEGKCAHNITKNCCYNASDCDDSLFCTEDLCTGNRCEHKNITCEVSSPCEIGVCVEPDGCRVYNKTNCVPNSNKAPIKKSFSEKVEDLRGSPIPKDKNSLVIGIILLLIILKVAFLR